MIVWRDVLDEFIYRLIQVFRTNGIQERLEREHHLDFLEQGNLTLELLKYSLDLIRADLLVIHATRGNQMINLGIDSRLVVG